MKKFTFFLMALLCHLISVQDVQAQSQSPKERFLELTSDLDMIPILQSTGIFYDQVPRYMRLYDYDGASVVDSIQGKAASVLLGYNIQ